jgi:hypothetical protein
MSTRPPTIASRAFGHQLHRLNQLESSSQRPEPYAELELSPISDVCVARRQTTTTVRYVEMTWPVRSLLSAALKTCSAFIGGGRAKSGEHIPEVFVHNPEAQGPQNLDDPFLDTNAQARVGEIIARAARRDLSTLDET